MAKNIRWDGTFGPVSGSTRFGIYDNDSVFQLEAPKTAEWIAYRLGYESVDVELREKHMYTVIEEAVSEYSAQVNQFNIRNNISSLLGQPTGSDYSQNYVQGNPINNVIAISDGYGTYAGVGGRTDIKKGYIETTAGQQEYDLQTLWADVSESAQRLDIYKVFYEATPAISRFFDPYSVSGQGTLNLIDEFGFGSFSPAAQFILMPMYEDLLRMQAIEFNDEIRKSGHTFTLVNNKLNVFPIPTTSEKMWFEYIVRNDATQGNTIVTPDVVSDFSNVRYDFIPYNKINSVGVQWIRKYALSLAKEVLGAIREKYSTVPISDSGDQATLDGAALRSEAQTEKDFLIEQLRQNLEEVSDKNRFETEADKADQQQRLLNKVPLPIWVGSLAPILLTGLF